MCSCVLITNLVQCPRINNLNECELYDLIQIVYVKRALWMHMFIHITFNPTRFLNTHSIYSKLKKSYYVRKINFNLQIYYQMNKSREIFL